MGQRYRFRRLVTCTICLTASLLLPGAASAQLNDDEGFNYDSWVNTLFAVTNPVPFWSVEPDASPVMLFKDGNKGDGGTTCLRTLIPVGTGTRRISDLNAAGDILVGGVSRHELDLITRLLLAIDDGTGSKLYRALGPLYPVLQPILGTTTSLPIDNPTELTFVAQSTTVFSAEDETNGRELWKVVMASDLTINAANLIADINPGPGSSSPSGFATVSSSLVFFSADNGTNGRELYSSNLGTASLVLDINAVVDPGDAEKTLSSDPQLLTALSGKVFFTADDGVNGRELWRSDGTALGTGLVKDIAPGASGSSPANLTAGLGALNTLLFFTVDSDGVNGPEVWKSAGALDGSDTVLVYDPAGAGSPTSLTSAGGTTNQLFFVLGNDLWKSAGTVATTALVKTFVAPPARLVAGGGTLYFVADDGTGSGLELWKTDGTTTTIVKDINPGGAGSSPQDLLAIGTGGLLYFSADDGTVGRELWRTDAVAGAVLVRDINPGAAGSHPVPRANFNDTVVFVADDGTHGAELWQTDGNEVATRSGMNYRWDLSGLIQTKGDAARIAVAGTDAAPFTVYWLHDVLATGGTTLVSDGGHQLNVYVELTDGSDRAPFTVSEVDCGDGCVPRPRVALTDGSTHNAIAFGMVAVLDQDPCDTTPRVPGSPGVPVAYVPAVYDGQNWIPMDRANIPPGVPTAPPSGTALGHNLNAWSPPEATGCGGTLPNPCPSWPGYLQTGFFPANNLPVAATVDPWARRRFTWARIDVWADYITVFWGNKQVDSVWVATLPRHYKGAFKTLYFGNRAGLQSAYPVYLDTLALNGGVLTPCVEPCGGACCQANGTCVNVASAAECPPGRYFPWRQCGDTTLPLCCPLPWADHDGDSDVDMDDFGALQACFTGAGGGVPAGCACLDKVKAPAGEIGFDDFDAFLACVSGPAVPFDLLAPPAGCSP